MRDRVLAFIDREEQQHIKVLISLCTVLFVVVISAVVIQWVHASASTYYVAPSGSDSNACTEAAPCLSFNRAYHVASPGDTVEVAAGTYVDQNLIEDNTKNGALQTVIFRPETNADVTVGSLNFGANYEDRGASHVEIRDMTSTGWAVLHRTTDVTFANMVFHGAVSAVGARQLTVTGGSWGDAAVTNDGVHPEFEAYQGNDTAVNPDGLTIQNVTVHDILRPNSSLHSACLQINDGVDITIRGNRFQHCDDVGALVSPSGLAAIDLLTYENNIFEPSTNIGATGQGSSSLQFDAASADITNVTVRSNSFAQAWTAGAGTSHAVSGSFIGNLGYSGGSCADAANQDWVFSHNLWLDGGNCDPSDANDSLANIAWTGDYHLQTTSTAIDAGDPSSCPAKDIDGDSRPQSAVCDAGADEYLAGSPAAPVNNALPTLSGSTVEAGQVRTTHGGWSGSPTYTYQWQRCNNLGASCTNISGATSGVYTLVTADVGSTVRSAVTAANGGGSTVAYSSATAVITADISLPANTVAPAISGVTAVDSVLTVAHGSWTNSPTYTYQWQRCNNLGASCTNISGATGSIYTVVAGDATNILRAVVTATNGAGNASANTAATAVIQSELGDFDANGVVNVFDLGIFMDRWTSASTSSPSQDMDGNGVVNVFDLGIFLSHYNR